MSHSLPLETGSPCEGQSLQGEPPQMSKCQIQKMKNGNRGGLVPLWQFSGGSAEPRHVCGSRYTGKSSEEARKGPSPAPRSLCGLVHLAFSEPQSPCLHGGVVGCVVSNTLLVPNCYEPLLTPCSTETHAFLDLPRTPNSGPLDSNKMYPFPPQSYREPSEGVASTCIPGGFTCPCAKQMFRERERLARTTQGWLLLCTGALALSLLFRASPKPPLRKALNLIEGHCWGHCPLPFTRWAHQEGGGGVGVAFSLGSGTCLHLTNWCGVPVRLSQLRLRVRRSGSQQSPKQDHGAPCRVTSIRGPTSRLTSDSLFYLISFTSTCTYLFFNLIYFLKFFKFS